MNNFISTFEELSKLYEEAPKEAQEATVEAEELVEAVEEPEIELVDDEAPVEEAPAEDTPVEEEPVAEEEPRQLVLECDKCGALILKSEADIVVDEKTDLVNVDEVCAFCEEAAGYKIMGVFTPYEVEEVPEETAPEVEEAEQEVEEDEVVDEDEIVEEGLGDVYRRVFDKPASVRTQQAWEDELNGEMGEISPERRAELEKKFAQQRDWEARHAKDEELKKEELEELLDVDVPINITANGNDVAVGGLA